MDANPIGDGSWCDITKEFLGSVKELSLGELLHSDHFTLLEAMSALELMDPKVDSGMILRRSKREILNLEQSIKAGTVKINQIEPEELAGIIDETYACLVTWLEGNSLAQTVMTNLYLHDPDKIEDRPLKVFSQSALKIVDSIDKIAIAVCCFEEEDFLLSGGKFNLASNLSSQKVLSSLDDLCQQFEKLLIERPSENHGNKKQNKNTIIPEDRQNLSKTQLSAIINRLRFTYNFFACFNIIDRQLLKDSWEFGPLRCQTQAQSIKTYKLVLNSALSCDQHLKQCLAYIDKWCQTIDFGLKPKPNDNLEVGDYPTIMGFDPLINHKLLSAAYPRCPSIKSRPQTLEYLKNFITNLRQCISKSGSFSLRSLSKSLETIEQFSKYSQPPSCVISRSFIQILYLPNRTLKLMTDELLQSMNEFCEPLVQAMRSDEAGLNAMDEFLADSSKHFVHITSLYGHNTARQHEKLIEIITSFRSLQYSALLLNNVFRNSVLYTWSTYHLTKLCIKYVLSGLELELFSAYEYPYVFWYLYDILFRTEREQLDLAKRSILEYQLILETDNLKKNKGQKQRKKYQCKISFHDRNLQINEAFRFMTGGTFLLSYGLRLQGKIKSPLMDFTSEEICFNHRFASLTGTSLYQSYKQALNRLEKPDHIYLEATVCFSEAKNLFETLEGYNDCLKVCKANMVVSKILSSNKDFLSDREVEFSFDAHTSFPTVKTKG